MAEEIRVKVVAYAESEPSTLLAQNLQIYLRFRFSLRKFEPKSLLSTFSLSLAILNASCTLSDRTVSPITYRVSNSLRRGVGVGRSFAAGGLSRVIGIWRRPSKRLQSSVKSWIRSSKSWIFSLLAIQVCGRLAPWDAQDGYISAYQRSPPFHPECRPICNSRYLPHRRGGDGIK